MPAYHQARFIIPAHHQARFCPCNQFWRLFCFAVCAIVGTSDGDPNAERCGQCKPL